MLHSAGILRQYARSDGIQHHPWLHSPAVSQSSIDAGMEKRILLVAPLVMMMINEITVYTQVSASGSFFFVFLYNVVTPKNVPPFSYHGYPSADLARHWG